MESEGLNKITLTTTNLVSLDLRPTMKGFAVVLIVCFACFYTAPSHAYSIKFISEEDSIARRQGTESESPSLDAGTTRDVAQSSNNDTAVREDETVKMEKNVKSVDESVQGDKPAEQSKIRKRDTRSVVRNLTPDMQDSDPVDVVYVTQWLKIFAKFSFKCFQEILHHLELEGIDPGFFGDPRLTKKKMLDLLQHIEEKMSECYTNMVPYETNFKSDVGLRDFEDDDTPITVNPGLVVTEPGLLTREDLREWIATIGHSMKKCFTDVIKLLQNKFASRNTPEQTSRSSNSVYEVLDELLNFLLLSGIGNDTQVNSFVPTDELYVTTTKRKDGFGPQDIQYFPVPGGLPGVAYPGASSIVIPIPKPKPTSSSYDDGDDYTDYYVDKGIGLEDGIAANRPISTILPNFVPDVKKSAQNYSLLNAVLEGIYAKLKGKAPYVLGEVQPKDSVRSVSDFLSLLARASNQPINTITKSNHDHDVIACIESCLSGEKRAASKRGII